MLNVCITLGAQIVLMRRLWRTKPIRMLFRSAIGWPLCIGLIHLSVIWASIYPLGFRSVICICAHTCFLGSIMNCCMWWNDLILVCSAQRRSLFPYGYSIFIAFQRSLCCGEDLTLLSGLLSRLIGVAWHDLLWHHYYSISLSRAALSR